MRSRLQSRLREHAQQESTGLGLPRMYPALCRRSRLDYAHRDQTIVKAIQARWARCPLLLPGRLFHSTPPPWRGPSRAQEPTAGASPRREPKGFLAQSAYDCLVEYQTAPLTIGTPTAGDQHPTLRESSDPSLGASPRIPARRKPERLAVELVPSPENDQLRIARFCNCEFGNCPTRPLSSDHMARRQPKPTIAGRHAAQRKGHAASTEARVRARYRSVTNAGVGFDPIAAIPGLSDRERAEFRAALRAVRTPEGREEIIRAARETGEGKRDLIKL